MALGAGTEPLGTEPGSRALPSVDPTSARVWDCRVFSACPNKAQHTCDIVGACGTSHGRYEWMGSRHPSRPWLPALSAGLFY